MEKLRHRLEAHLQSPSCSTAPVLGPGLAPFPLGCLGTQHPSKYPQAAGTPGETEDVPGHTGNIYLLVSRSQRGTPGHLKVYQTPMEWLEMGKESQPPAPRLPAEATMSGISPEL